MRLFLPILPTSTQLHAVSFKPSYALATGKQDLERLTILNELYNSRSLPLLEITPNLRILTFGCGIGLLELEMARMMGSTGLILATDISAAQLAIAEQNRQKFNIKNLQFLQIDVENLKIPGQFDRIHCRFVLSHLPWKKILKIVPNLYNMLAPDGLLLLEEIATLDSLACEPFFDIGYDMWKACFYKQFAYQQSDTSPGKRLFAYLQKEGYLASYTSHQPVLRSLREKSILALGAQSVSEKLLQEQLMSTEELEEMITLLQKLEKNPDTFPKYCEMSQIAVRRP